MKHCVWLRALRYWLTTPRTSTTAARHQQPRFRPALEGLEERLAPAVTPVVSHGTTAALVRDAGYGRPAVLNTGNDVVTVTRQSTSFTNSASQTLTLTAKVTGPTGRPVNEGNVTFNVAGLPAVTAAVNTSGAASTTLVLPAAFPAGTHAITATYADPAGTFPGGSGTGTLTVYPAATNIAVSEQNATFNSGAAQQVTVSADVTSPNGGTVNEGSVVFFFMGGLPPVRAAVNSSGVASATVTLPAGMIGYQYTIAAFYYDAANGNDTINFSRNHNWNLLTVNPAATTTTAADVSAPFNPLGSQQVHLTANVTSATGGTVREGAVTFIVNRQWLTAAVNSSGVATADLTLPAGFPAGSYAIYATYTDVANARGAIDYSFSNNVLSPATLTVE
jgi:hypothetical protein